MQLHPFCPVQVCELSRTDVKHFAFYSGRAAGKSVGIAWWLINEGLERPLRVLCLRERLKSLDSSSKQLLVDWIDALNLRSHYTVLGNEIRGVNGTSFRFYGLGSHVGQIRSSAGVDVAWIDEAHEASQASLITLRPTIRDPGSKAIYSWNPQQNTDPVDLLFRGNHPPAKSIIRPMSHTLNPFLAEDVKLEIAQDYERDPDLAAHVWGGSYLIRSEAQVFNDIIIEDRDADLSDDPTPLLGLDLGFGKHPTVLVETHQIGNDTIYIRQEKVAIKLPLRDMSNWMRSFQSVQDGHLVIVDSHRPDVIENLKSEHLPVTGAVKGKGSVIAGVDWLRTQNIVIHPRCKRASAEFRSYSYKIDSATGEPLPELATKQSDHTVDAVRYATERLRKPARSHGVGIVAPELIYLH